MPTIALNYSVSYALLSKLKLDIVKTFPPIRVWGTIGFIVAAWVIDLMHWSHSENQFFLSIGASVFLGIYAFTLPKTPMSEPEEAQETHSFWQLFGGQAMTIFKNRRLLIFLIFSIFMGSLLQITNIWGVPF